MRCFVRFVMFLIYIDIVFVLLVFMVPTEMMYRWSDGKNLTGMFHACQVHWDILTVIVIR